MDLSWDSEICELCGGFGECADGNCDDFDGYDWAFAFIVLNEMKEEE
tara:strand:- start:92 stop:232 length:141 start_codon:yes stop_codon:yes gene_type:complete